jgi:hypothetical protein
VLAVRTILHVSNRNSICYLLADLHPEPTPLFSVDFPCDLHSPPSLFLYSWFFPIGLNLQPPADAGSPLADFSTLKMEAIRSSEMSISPGSTQHHIPEDDILQQELICRLQFLSCFL